VGERESKREREMSVSVFMSIPIDAACTFTPVNFLTAVPVFTILLHVRESVEFDLFKYNVLMH
jgi:hypothetical protein